MLTTFGGMGASFTSQIGFRLPRWQERERRNAIALDEVGTKFLQDPLGLAELLEWLGFQGMLDQG